MAYVSEPHLDRQDELLKFGTTNKITSAATYPCGYSADYTDGIALDIGESDLEGMSVIFHVEVATSGVTNATFKVFVSNDKSSWTEVAASPAIAGAQLTADKEFAVAIPRGAAVGRYVKAAVTTTGSGSDGKVSAYVDSYIGK